MKISIALLMTGDEILSGDTLDTNSNFFCREVNQLGLRVDKIIVCGDNKNQLTAIIKQLIDDFDVVIINGGLGPTEDDYTHEVLSLAADSKLVLNDQAKQYISSWLNKKGYSLGPANLKQAYFPQAASVIVNTKGSAPGAMLKKDGSIIFTTPGVPSESREMWRSFIKQKLIDFAKTDLLTTVKLRSFGLGESVIQDAFNFFNIKSTKEVKIGFRAHFPYVDCKITFNNKLLHSKLVQNTILKVTNILSDYLISKGEVDLEKLVVEKLTSNFKKVALAESVTGGMVSSLFTSVPGASKVLEYGLVTYANSSKANLLSIDEKLIVQKGPVSEFTALSMLKGLSDLSKADYAAATTGLAGLASSDGLQPAGTVFIALQAKHGVRICRKFQFSQDRLRGIKLCSYVVLDGLRRILCDLPLDMLYSFDAGADKANLAKKLRSLR